MTTGRHYTRADLGPLCAAGCGTRIVRQLAAAGITEHPSCVRAVVRQLDQEQRTT